MSEDNNTRQGDSQTESDSDNDNNKPLTFLEVLGSTFAAAIGVQSKENKKRDFTRGNAAQFIAAGIIFTVVFIVGMILIVNLVLAS